MYHSFNDFFNTNNNFDKYSGVQSVIIQGKHNTTPPEYTFFIPTYKRANLLIETINSVISQNTNIAYEIIVVDNNPDRNDETELAIRKYNDKEQLIYYKNSKNIGVVGNWNRGYELSRTKWVIMLHDDDLVSDNYLSIVSQYANEDIDGIFSKAQPFSTIEDLPQLDIKDKICIKKASLYDSCHVNTYCVVANLMKRETVLRLGGFDENMYPSLDYHFFTKLAYYGKVIKIDCTLSYYRILVNSTMRPEIMDGCLVKGEPFRIAMLVKLGINRVIASFVQIYNTKKKEAYFAREWDENFVSSIHTNTNKGIVFISRVLYYIVYYYLAIKKRFYEKCS